MKFTDLLLPLTILLISMESFTSWATENENIFPLSNCSKTCGDIKIEYPFGIGVGCYRSVEFNLTCAYDSDPPRLLLGNDTIQVRNFNMEKGLVYIEPPYVTLNADEYMNSTSIDLKNLPLSFNLGFLYSSISSDSMTINNLYVAGCNATANILDLSTNGIIGVCSTICSPRNTSTTKQIFMSDNGYCRLDMFDVKTNKNSWAIQLTRLNETENENSMISNNTSSIIALIYDEDSSNHDDLQKFINNRNKTGSTATLAWYINDYPTCKEDTKRSDTYACRSHKSECFDVFTEDSPYRPNETIIGYNCRCSLDYDGNPYLPDGCKIGNIQDMGYRCNCSDGYFGNPYLHDGCKGESKLSWDDRLRIATESAGALAYLHSAASISIFHRDVKSSNILLDDTFRAKVSDFGASRFIPLNQTHIVTAIQGTFGYLDPEYYQTSQLTEKNDVYSFGVILLELLTGKKPINSTNDGSQQNLAMNFLQAMRENMLFDLIEDRILHEGTKQELLEISSLIKICLSLKGAERPTMKEVEYKLQSMRKTRMKKRGICIPEGNEEAEHLLNMPSYSSSELMDQINQENSRNYSFEKEVMWSQNYPC
ncbi:hypothetical protein ZIOFF_001900 [Zingiber officinale]|uniref:Protein kinase domain-containing protein n=1 Tax=Zingiber officinale TaxID=94328 RepID=A0A8J5I6A1_ZINOF|nr:hypothetical protein ZIOFF_001900 [Zingiber officinale]